MAAVQDAIHHKVSNCITGAVCLLGAVSICIKAEDRWDTIVLTCLFLLLLFGVYVAAVYIGRKAEKKLCFGGADIKLMAGAMIFLGWQEALEGMFAGLSAAVVWYLGRKTFEKLIQGRKELKREIPLVPWLVGGICIMKLLTKL